MLSIYKLSYLGQFFFNFVAVMHNMVVFGPWVLGDFNYSVKQLIQALGFVADDGNNRSIKKNG